MIPSAISIWYWRGETQGWLELFVDLSLSRITHSPSTQQDVPTASAHIRLRGDEGKVDGNKSDKDVVCDVEAILHDLEEFRSHRKGV